MKKESYHCDICDKVILSPREIEGIFISHPSFETIFEEPYDVTEVEFTIANKGHLCRMCQIKGLESIISKEKQDAMNRLYVNKFLET